MNKNKTNINTHKHLPPHKKKKLNQKTSSWSSSRRSTLDPYSIRICTVSLKPSLCSQVKSSPSILKQKEIFKKKKKKKNNNKINESSLNPIPLPPSLSHQKHNQYLLHNTTNENEKKKKKEIQITLSWRSMLDPCSTRIFTISSNPLKAAMWRAVHPNF